MQISKIRKDTAVEAVNDFCKGFLRLPKMPSISKTFAHSMGIQDVPTLNVFQSGFDSGNSRTRAPSSKPSIIRNMYSPDKKIKRHSEIFSKLKKMEQSNK